MSLNGPGVARLFLSGARDVSDPLQRVVGLGELNLVTGRLVFLDPFQYDDWIPRPYMNPFSVAVAPGRYRVAATVVTGGGLPFQTASAVKVTIRDEPIVDWEPARQEIWPADEPSMQTIQVANDSGGACLVDASAMEALLKAMRPGDAFFQHPVAPGSPGVNVVLDSVTGLNTIVLQCGEAEFPTWLGRTATGEPGCFITDFQVDPPRRIC